jgi:phage terminase large subunit GpA-like protein
MSKAKDHIELTRSEFAENFLHLKGEPFSLDDYPFMRNVYNNDTKDIVLKFSRQTGKSSTLANLIVTNCAMIPNFGALYLSPTLDQTKIFSADRVKPVMMQSPFIKKYLVDQDGVNNVFNKEFTNGSHVYLKYALLNADRIRGISADMVLADEAQDLLPDILPVVYETMSRSEYK